MWRAVVGCLVLALLNMTPLHAAPAQEPGVPVALAALLTHPDHLAALERAARAADPPHNTPCTDADYETTGQIGIVQPLRTDERGQLVAGLFKESVHEHGCGMDRTLNALTRIGPNGMTDTQPLLPGSTIADPELQKDSVPFAAGAMGPIPPDCPGGAVVDTRFIGLEGHPAGVHPKAGDRLRPWTEIWTLQACAARVNVAMRFAPDATGTDISAEPMKE